MESEEGKKGKRGKKKIHIWLAGLLVVVEGIQGIAM